MKNPIGNVGMFATPDNMEAFEDYMMKVSKASGNGPAVVTVAMMAWNLAGKYVKEAIEKEAAEKAKLAAYGARAWRDRKNA